MYFGYLNHPKLIASDLLLLLLLFNKIIDFKIQNALSFLTSSKKFDQNDVD
jgi:hypothetical protein